MKNIIKNLIVYLLQFYILVNNLWSAFSPIIIHVNVILVDCGSFQCAQFACITVIIAITKFYEPGSHMNKSFTILGKAFLETITDNKQNKNISSFWFRLLSTRVCALVLIATTTKFFGCFWK